MDVISNIFVTQLTRAFSRNMCYTDDIEKIKKREIVMSYDELMEAYKNSQKENEKLKNIIENQQLQINTLNRYLFGSKRESIKPQEEIIDGEQCTLFAEEDEQGLKKAVQKEVAQLTVHKKKNARKQTAGIKRSAMKDVKIQRKEYLLEDYETNCDICGSKLEVIGKEIVRKEIEIIPAQIKVNVYVKWKYKCTKCGTADSEKETPTFEEPDVEQPLLAHSFLSPSLATEVIYQKYHAGIPLYRQEKIWDDKGLVLPRYMMANWCIKLKEYYLQSLYELMLKEIKKENHLLHMDETTVQCNKEKDKKASTNSYMWVIASGEEEKNKGVIFKYSSSRSKEVAKSLLKDFTGILITDGYAGYNEIEGVTHAECWAHARRYFYESIPLKSNKELDTEAAGYKGVQFCDKLFEVEREIEGLNDDEKVKIRNEKSKPILEEFYNWVNLVMSEKVVLNSKLKKALVYVTNQRKELSEFLNDGRIPLTNSRCERAIRPFAVHRKNWLFADSVAGAEANAVYYSIVESAKANKLNIHKYIQYLLEEIPQLENPSGEKELKKYLPWSKKLPEELMGYEDDSEVVGMKDIEI